MGGLRDGEWTELQAVYFSSSDFLCIFVKGCDRAQFQLCFAHQSCQVRHHVNCDWEFSRTSFM